MRVKLTSVLVDDPIKAFDFYTKVLGFQELAYSPEMNLAIVVSPEDPDGTGLLLEPGNNPIAKPFREGVYAQGMPAMIFGVDNVQAEYERLKAQGVRFTQEPVRNEFGAGAIFDDGCGNLIQIHED